MSKRGTGASRVVAHLDDESRAQIEILSQVFRLGPSAVISMAVARWFHTEPLVRDISKVKNDGDNNTGL